MLEALRVAYWSLPVTSRDSATRRRAAAALGKSRSARAVRPLLRALAKPITFEARDPLTGIEDTCYETGYLVDALAALGPGAVPELCAELSHRSPFVVEGVVTALWRIGDARAAEPLSRCLKPELPYDTRKTAALALAKLKWTPDTGPNHVWCELLIWPQYTFPGGEQMPHAAEVARRLRGTQEAFAALVECLKEPPSGYHYTPPSIAARAAWVLGAWGDERAIGPLLDARNTRWCDVEATEALAYLGEMAPLTDLLRSPRPSVTPEEFRSLIDMPEPRVIPPLVGYAKRFSKDLPESYVRLFIEKLRGHGQAGLEGLRGLLNHPVAKIREQALRELQSLGWQAASDEAQALAAFADPQWTDLHQHGLQVWEWVLACDAAPMNKTEALARCGQSIVGPLLTRLPQGDTVVIAALGRLRDRRAAKPLASLYWSSSGVETRIQDIRKHALAALVELGMPGAFALVEHVNSETTAAERVPVIAALGEFPFSLTELPLLKAGDCDDEQVRAAVAKARAKGMLLQLAQCLADKDPRVAHVARQATFTLTGLISGHLTANDIQRLQEAFKEIDVIRSS